MFLPSDLAQSSFTSSYGGLGCSRLSARELLVSGGEERRAWEIPNSPCGQEKGSKNGIWGHITLYISPPTSWGAWTNWEGQGLGTWNIGSAQLVFAVTIMCAQCLAHSRCSINLNSHKVQSKLCLGVSGGLLVGGGQKQ